MGLYWRSSIIIAFSSVILSMKADPFVPIRIDKGVPKVVLQRPQS
jgi:hypothetical protein